MTNPVTPEEAVDSILEYCWALDFDGTPNDDIFHNPEKIAEIITAQRALAVEEYKTQVAEVYPQMIYFPELLETLGWQGGTIHQVIDEIKRLKEAENSNLARLQNARPEVIEAFKQNLEKHSTLAKHLAQMEQADLPRHSSDEPEV